LAVEIKYRFMLVLFTVATQLGPVSAVDLAWRNSSATLGNNCRLRCAAVTDGPRVGSIEASIILMNDLRD
jgi:steroid 5-alpha reductase family enzyme